MVTRDNGLTSGSGLRDVIGEYMRRLEERRAADPEAYDREVREFEERQAREDAEMDAARVRSARDGRITASGAVVPDAAREAILDGALEPRYPVRVARDWWSTRDKPWLVLSGQTDVGKTIAAAMLVAEARSAYWLHAADAVRVFAGLFGDSVDRQERARNVDLLVIDDVGSEADAERMQVTLVELLDKRCMRSRPTIITTNHTKASFDARFQSDARLRRRMRDFAKWVQL